MLLDPRAGSLRLRQRREHQTQRHTPKQSKDDLHLDGEHSNKALLAKTLSDVAHPADEGAGPNRSVASQRMACIIRTSSPPTAR
jgi:hypothetical protein